MAVWHMSLLGPFPPPWQASIIRLGPLSQEAALSIVSEQRGSGTRLHCVKSELCYFEWVVCKVLRAGLEDALWEFTIFSLGLHARNLDSHLDTQCPSFLHFQSIIIYYQWTTQYPLDVPSFPVCHCFKIQILWWFRYGEANRSGDDGPLER